jgi:hypothetical protein
VLFTCSVDVTVATPVPEVLIERDRKVVSVDDCAITVPDAV